MILSTDAEKAFDKIQHPFMIMPFPSPGDLPDPGTEPVSSASPALAVGSLPLSHLRSPCTVDNWGLKTLITTRILVTPNPRPTRHQYFTGNLI